MKTPSKPILAAALICLLSGPAVLSAECLDVPEPVVALDHGSRYTADSEDRSDIDRVSNASVTAALKPIDKFISALAKTSNRALLQPRKAQAHAACVGDALAVWADADALSQLESVNAQMSAPSRIAGLAFAYATIRPMLDDKDQRKLIDDWLRRRADAIVEYWDRESPKNASRNNLRAWAAVAVARIGLSLDEQRLQHWAAYSALRVACDAEPDGSLPMEMARGPLALHYQLHAVGPLVVTAALLREEGFLLFAACDRAIPRAAEFAVAAINDPHACGRPCWRSSELRQRG